MNKTKWATTENGRQLYMHRKSVHLIYTHSSCLSVSIVHYSTNIWMSQAKNSTKFNCTTRFHVSNPSVSYIFVIISFFFLLFLCTMYMQKRAHRKCFSLLACKCALLRTEQNKWNTEHRIWYGTWVRLNFKVTLKVVVRVRNDWPLCVENIRIHELEIKMENAYAARARVYIKTVMYRFECESSAFAPSSTAIIDLLYPSWWSEMW